MRDVLAVIAGLVAVVSTLPYIRDTLKGKTHPNIVTWSTWTLINIIIALAALSGHAIQTAIFAGSFAICTGLVVVVGFRTGIKRYTLFDFVCQILALIGIVLWRITDNPSVAILFNIIADCIGVLPTYRHSWLLPTQETWQTYAIGALSATLDILSIKHFNFLSAGYPIYIFISDVSLVWVIVYRRKIKLQS